MAMHKPFLNYLFAAVVLFCSCSVNRNVSVPTATPVPRYKVAVIDLMLLKRQKLGAFQLTKDIGADGLEVDMGGLGNRPTFDNQLLIDSVRQKFLATAKEQHVEIFSIAMTGYYA